MGTTFGGVSGSPYPANSGRLADVIAAIQAMGTYKFYKLSFEYGLTASPRTRTRHYIGKTFSNSTRNSSVSTAHGKRRRSFGAASIRNVFMSTLKNA
jgi:hypothetical protein